MAISHHFLNSTIYFLEKIVNGDSTQKGLIEIFNINKSVVYTIKSSGKSSNIEQTILNMVKFKNNKLISVFRFY